MSLDLEIKHFNEHRDTYVEEHRDKYVVIHDNTEEGFYDSHLEAYLAAKRKFQPGKFLIH